VALQLIFAALGPFFCYEKFGQKLPIKASKGPIFFCFEEIVTLKSVISKCAAQDKK